MSFGPRPSRETVVQFVAVGLAILTAAVADRLEFVPDSGPLSVAVTAVYVGLIFGGSHLYLALRGDGKSVSVGARWRWVATLAGLLAAWVIVAIAGIESIAGVDVSTVGSWGVLAVVAAYLVIEARAAYNDVGAG